jgi:hypothetical protein
MIGLKARNHAVGIQGGPWVFFQGDVDCLAATRVLLKGINKRATLTSKEQRRQDCRVLEFTHHATGHLDPDPVETCRIAGNTGQALLVEIGVTITKGYASRSRAKGAKRLKGHDHRRGKATRTAWYAPASSV